MESLENKKKFYQIEMSARACRKWVDLGIGFDKVTMIK